MEQMSFENVWFDEEVQTDISTQKLDQLIADYANQRKIVDNVSDELKKQEEKLHKMDAKLIEYLESLGRSSYDSPYGKITRETRFSVKLPQGEDKVKFFEYLKEKKVFEDMVHMNSRTLQTFYRAEMEAHKSVPGWKVPGCGEPSGQVIVKFKKGEKKDE
jgi:uncharacterized coiled-coil protein SlyX